MPPATTGVTESRSREAVPVYGTMGWAVAALDPAVFDCHDGSCRHVVLDERQGTLEDRIDELDP